MPQIKLRKPTWYWKIWWFLGYHGLYQINWGWKKVMAFFKDLFKSKPKPTNFKPKKISEKIEAIISSGKKTVEVYDLVRKTSVGHHAWYNPNVGLIKKPIQS